MNCPLILNPSPRGEGLCGGAPIGSPHHTAGAGRFRVLPAFRASVIQSRYLSAFPGGFFLSFVLLIPCATSLIQSATSPIPCATSLIWCANSLYFGCTGSVGSGFLPPQPSFVLSTLAFAPGMEHPIHPSNPGHPCSFCIWAKHNSPIQFPFFVHAFRVENKP